MKTRELQEARDFAGADWESMRTDLRKDLLRGYGIATHYHALSWWQLPPTIKQELAVTLLKKKAA